MHSIRRVISLAMIVLVAVLAADIASVSAQQDPRVGTWKLNVAKSKYDPRAGAPEPDAEGLR